MDNFAIDIQNVSKRYGPKRVLDGITLGIPKGSVFGLLGRNGSGKTTLIKTLLGLIKPDAGGVRTLHDEPWCFKEATKSRLGYVPQSDRMYPWLKVKELISYTASFISAGIANSSSG
jgi:ABC-2 type transport system ATP-binding protein